MGRKKMEKDSPNVVDPPPLKKTIVKSKKGKKNYSRFATFLFKLLRSTIDNEKIGISRKSMHIMNDFVGDMLENIASEAGRVANMSKRNTLTSRDIQTAVKLLIPGELAKHANMEGTKAVTLYHNSRKQ